MKKNEKKKKITVTVKNLDGSEKIVETEETISTTDVAKDTTSEKITMSRTASFKYNLLYMPLRNGTLDMADYSRLGVGIEYQVFKGIYVGVLGYLDKSAAISLGLSL